jgi:hypothetical protein
MRQIRISGYAFALVCLALADPRKGDTQTLGVVFHSDTYAVSISMEQETVPGSESPIVLLAIRNASSERISRDDCSSDPRVWVQGEHGEPPTTYRERFSTLRLLPGEPDLACTLNNTWSLAPGETLTKHVLLKYLYDLHEPGSYSVYIEFPTGEGWLRTNTVNFRVMAEGPSQAAHNGSPTSKSN